MKKILIIGAGPAGLTAAYELLKKNNDYEVTVFEETSVFGGISRTVNYKGNRMDMGGHRFFSKVPEVNEWWDKMLPMQGAKSFDDILLKRDSYIKEGGPDPEKEDRVMLTRHRVSRIFFDDKFYDYPISLKPETFKNFGFITTMKVGFSYL
ncbi:MAG: NAD(P)-binding protein [Spirochaetaceae bacterium]|nr:NAD(P)-binding protein [Spirochaetaceae bacterium]